MTIIGTLMGTETLQRRGQALLGSRYWFLTTGWIYMVGGATDKEANDVQARLPVAREMERHVRSVDTKREAKVGYRKTEDRQCKRIARYVFH